MKILNPSYKIIKQLPKISGMMKQIEYCGRISHKSEDKITDNSYVDFIEKMRKLKHFATFEHGTVYLKLKRIEVGDEKFFEVQHFYDENPYSKVYINNAGCIYITTNYRVICENEREDDLKYWCEPTDCHEKRYTVIFICDIGVSREFNRHRVDSILEESTRYCNYTKDKFGGELNIMIPIWLKERKKEIEYNLRNDFKGYCSGFMTGSELNDIDYWLMANFCSEFCYTKLINDFKWTPQQARTILPLDTKTTLAHTAFESDWKHFFDLRAIGITGAPHPSAKELAEPLMNEMKNLSILNYE